VWWPRGTDLDTLHSGRAAIGVFVNPAFLLLEMEGVIFLVIFLALFRRKLPAVAATFLVMLISLTDADLRYISHPAQQAILAADAMTTALLLFVATRFGLLALMVSGLFYLRLLEFPVTLDMSSWYATTSTLLLVTLSAIVLYAFNVATTRHGIRGVG